MEMVSQVAGDNDVSCLAWQITKVPNLYKIADLLGQMGNF